LRVVIGAMAGCRLILGILVFGLTGGLGQTFEVAWLKALPGATHGGPHSIAPDGVNFQGSSLGFLVRWAYGLHPDQTFETVGPAWIDAGLGCVWFSVAAKAGHPVPVDELRLMLRALLAERLKLAVNLLPIGVTVAIGVCRQWVRPSQNFLAVGDSVAVGVGVLRIGSQAILFQIREPVAIVIGIRIGTQSIAM